MQRINEPGVVLQVGVLALGIGLLSVDPQPLVQATGTILVEHRADRGVRVPLHADHGREVFAGEAVALDHLPVVGLGAVLGPVDHERIDPLPGGGQLVLEVDGVLSVHPLDPLQRLAPLDDRTLEHRVGERHQIVHELVELVEKPTLDHLVVHLALHVLGFTRGVLAQLVDHDLLARYEVLLQLVFRWVDPHRGGDGQLLTDALVGALHELRRQLRHGGRAQDVRDGPLPRVVHHVTNPARRGTRLVRGQH